MKTAIASLVSGLLVPAALVLWWFVLTAGFNSPLLTLLWLAVPGPLVAIVLGHLARSEVKRIGADPAAGRYAAAGLALGYLELALIVLIVAAAVAFIIRFQNYTF